MGNSSLNFGAAVKGDTGATGATGAAGPPTTIGLYSARGAAGTDGSQYYATDQVALYIAITGSWVRLGPQAGDIIWTAETTARTGYILAQGQAISRSGINTDLFTNWGTKFGNGDGTTTFNVFDGQGRNFVSMAGAGGHTDVTTIGNADVATLANRRQKHAHTLSGGLQGGGSPNSGGSSSIVTSGLAGGANATILGSLAVGVAGMSDTAAYIVLHAQIKL